MKRNIHHLANILYAANPIIIAAACSATLMIGLAATLVIR